MTNNRKQSKSAPNPDGGRVPPHDRELERALLGAMMLEPATFYEVAGFVSSEIFYEDRHAVIFSLIKALADAGSPIDLYTVSQKARESKRLESTGGASYLAQLTQAIGSSAHAVHHARLLWQMWVQRTMATDLSNLAAKCYELEFDALSAEYQTTLARLDSIFVGSGSGSHIRTILRRHAEMMEERAKRANRNEIQGATYGLERLDRMTGGMLPGQLIILAARPAMGKTAIALKFAKSAALGGAHVAIASLEMTDLSLTDRLVSSYAGVDSSRLRTGRMDSRDWTAYERAASELGKLNIYIDDTAGTTLGRLGAMARTKRRKGELDLLIIDYLQLIESDQDGKDYRRNREREVADISRGLKKLAKDLDIPVVLLCQLNRAAESRADKQPQLYDLRESGSIEQDADVVMMPFRPAYYKDLVFTDDNDVPMPSDAGFIFIRKQREGSLGPVMFQYSEDLSKIEDYDSTTPQSDDHGLFSL